MTKGRRFEIAFACPHCGREATAGAEAQGSCGHCGRQPVLDPQALGTDPPMVKRCAVCSGEELFVQRDFNQKTGLAIVVLGAVLAPFTPYYSSLFVAAALDAVLHTVLPEITICYRCQAHYRGFVRNPRHGTFDLHHAEQYDSGRRGAPGGPEPSSDQEYK